MIEFRSKVIRAVMSVTELSSKFDQVSKESFGGHISSLAHHPQTFPWQTLLFSTYLALQVTSPCLCACMPYISICHLVLPPIKIWQVCIELYNFHFCAFFANVFFFYIFKKYWPFMLFHIRPNFNSNFTKFHPKYWNYQIRTWKLFL